MWILEGDGLAPAGRRIWLRPGKTYLFGRTKLSNKAVNAGFVLDEKSVSRKHLTIAVSPVKSGDGSNLESRSELSIQDENTRFGTEVDGKQIKGSRMALQGDEHVFYMGRHKQPFRIKWQLVVLSFNFSSKETKGGKDPLIPIRSRLEDMDIKTIIQFIPDKTTHVVAAKRNVPKGLQALIYAKPIVDNGFIDALVYATSPENLDEPESLSPLETDFNQSWPKEQDYLPPPSKEPGQQPAEVFSPDPTRKDIFIGYTFVFFDQAQFDTLQSLITDGGGKSLYFPIELGVTTAVEIAQHLRAAAGEKGVGEFQDGCEGKGPVHVVFLGGKYHEEWARIVQREVESITGQQAVGQNEFLEIILIKDASRLRRHVPTKNPEETTGQVASSNESRSAASAPRTSGTPPTAQPTVHVEQEMAEQNPPQPRSTETTMPPVRRVRPRGTIVSAFRGFDDGFEPTQVPTQRKQAQLDLRTAQSQSGHSQVDDDDDDSARMAVDTEEADQPIATTRTSRKRPLPSDDDDDDDNESLLPAAAAMKRMRVEEEAEARRRGVSIEPAFGSSKTAQPAPPPKPKRPKKKEVDIQEAVRERRKAEDEAAQRDEESLRQTLDDMTVEEMRNLAVVEEIEVPERQPLAQRANAQGDRWDERWNGRKNFKKFRRQGTGPVPRRGQTVMVPLEEVRKNGQSIVAPPRNETRETTRFKPAGRRRLRGTPEVEEISPAQTFTSAQSNQEGNKEKEDIVAAEVEGGVEPEVIDVDAPRTTRSRNTIASATTSQTSRRGTKRPQPPTAVAGRRTGPAKKQKLLTSMREEEEESDSEEEMRFRFRKRT